MKEVEFLDLFCDFLDRTGYNYKREFRKGSYHNEGYVDVVIKENILLVGIEAKLKNFRAVMDQASGNWSLFSINYVLFPKVPSQRHLFELRRRGLGLIIPKYTKTFEIFQVFVKPRLHIKKYLGLHSWKAIRNWRENRAGRILNPNEISEGYDYLKLQSTYDWCRKGED